MKTRIRPGRLVIPLLIAHAAAGFAAQTISSPTKTVRIAAAQAARRVIDFRLKSEEALAALEKNLAELERIVDRAGEAKCDALVLPEDTPGLLNWVGANETLATEVLPKAVKRMLERLGSAAVRHRMYLVVCSDLTESEEEFTQANSLVGSGKTDEAISAFERLRKEYPATWIDRSSEERLAKLKTRGGVEQKRPDSRTRSESASLSGPGGEGEGRGEAGSLAAKYPGDAGIANDPDVLFADNFESGVMKKWDQERGRVVMSETQPNSGRWSVQMPMERGKNHGGDAIKWFMPGANAVYARCYVKFSPDYQYNHHFVWLGANQRTNKWSAFGKAGLKPNGTYYSTGMEPWFAWGKNPPPGEVNLYTYYLDMEPDRKMDKYWGNGFFPPGPGKGKAAVESRVIPPLNQWQCWEFMIQANTAPDKADGKQAMWVDGKVAGEFTGIRWRNDMDLKVNCFWLEHYGYDEGDPTKQYWKESQSVWFDDVVVARRYVGPMKR